MWWRDLRGTWRRKGAVARLARFGGLAAALAAASFTAGCFQPLYSSHPVVGTTATEGVGDKLAAVDIPVIAAPEGSPLQRIAVGLRNALQYDLNGAAGARAPTHRLVVNVGDTQWTITIDPASGRPSAEIAAITADYQLIEIATGKTVMHANTFAHVDYDIPGVEQRFAKQRAQRDAEDHAVLIVADTIKNRLASYFVAGT